MVAVSYTHLDVYKRQSIYRVRSCGFDDKSTTTSNHIARLLMRLIFPDGQGLEANHSASLRFIGTS